MTSPNEFLVVHSKDWVVRVKEVWVEHDLHGVRLRIKELNATDLVQNGVVRIIGHIVSCDGRQGVALEGENPTLQENFVFV